MRNQGLPHRQELGLASIVQREAGVLIGDAAALHDATLCTKVALPLEAARIHLGAPKCRFTDTAFSTDEVKTEISDRFHLAVLVFS